MRSLKLLKGYSLMEIILYVALLGLFLASLTELFVSSFDLKLESETKSAVEQDGRYFLSRFKYEFSQATSITTPAAPGNQGGTLVLTRGATSYTFALSGNNLMETTDGVSYQLNSPRVAVSNLNFKRLGNSGGKNTISITYTLTSTTSRPKGPETRNYEIVYAVR